MGKARHAIQVQEETYEHLRTLLAEMELHYPQACRRLTQGGRVILDTAIRFLLAHREATKTKMESLKGSES